MLGFYKSMENVFIKWIENYISEVGRIKHNNSLELFLNEVKYAYKLVPKFSHLEEYDDDGDYIYHKFTDEDIEVMLQYFHDNPNVWHNYIYK